MIKAIESDYKFEIDVEFLIETNPKQSHGFGIYLLDQPPDELHDFNGIALDYKGLGIHIYRANDDRWYVVSK